ncbi:MAG TPA: glycosyltransferase family A protein [Chitinispirillaceae bacterium]|nr:glycosyltransferase family A protein [Chitinispirillaceae bacterium]
MSKYVLISSVRNEEKYISATIESVITQSVLPEKWILVSDCSTDNTDAIIRSYAEKIKWIVYKRNNEYKEGMQVSERKVYNVNNAVSMIEKNLYEYIGFIDGDIRFSNESFSVLINRLDSRPDLGLTGGYIYNYRNNRLFPMFTSKSGVGGPFQFFRKECYSQIGGYIPCAYEDSIAIVSAKMHGWEVTAFKDVVIHHLKAAGIPGRNAYKAKFNVGKMEYLTGDHWLYHFVRSAFTLNEHPFFISFLLKLSGYWFMILTGRKVKTPAHIVRYMRRMQLRKLGLGFMAGKIRLTVEKGS